MYQLYRNMVYVVAGRWQIEGKIGSGSFGEVFAAFDIQTLEKVAIKRELTTAECPQLPHECKK